MPLDMDISTSLAMSLSGGPKIPPRNTSLGASRPTSALNNRRSEISLYKGISDRPLGWKPRRKSKTLSEATLPRTGYLKIWDGNLNTRIQWDGLKRDPELWDKNGDCFVHLYAHGSSDRGPAFRIDFDKILKARCGPLISRFLVPNDDDDDEAVSESSKNTGNEEYNFYIPAPPTAENEKATMYHIATRNFFAWLENKPIVGSHLGGALVTLLNVMTELRCEDCDNVGDLFDYLDEQGYRDMRNSPDYALAILNFAGHVQLKYLWIDAFAHCAGMNELLPESSEFEHIDRVTYSLIYRGRLEMDIRLERCGKSLSSFLEDELSSTNIKIPENARAELDRFRSFLHSYYVSKLLGYYPPLASRSAHAAFPNHVLSFMCEEFQDLYDYLVDESSSTVDQDPETPHQRINLLQTIHDFNRKLRCLPLDHPLPHLPQELPVKPQRHLSTRLSWVNKPDKMEPDDRLVHLSSLSKACNRRKTDLLQSSLVKAFRNYEKECVFPLQKNEKMIRISSVEARKVRWILIYAMLQTLKSVTTIPEEVCDTDVPYNLCVLTAGCPPWEINISNGDYHLAVMETANIAPQAEPEPKPMEVDFDQLAMSLTPDDAADVETEDMNITKILDYFSLPPQHLHLRDPSLPNSSTPDSGIVMDTEIVENLPSKPLRSPKGSITQVFETISEITPTPEEPESEEPQPEPAPEVDAHVEFEAEAKAEIDDADDDCCPPPIPIRRRSTAPPQAEITTSSATMSATTDTPQPQQPTHKSTASTSSAATATSTNSDDSFISSAPTTPSDVILPLSVPSNTSTQITIRPNEPQTITSNNDHLLTAFHNSSDESSSDLDLSFILTHQDQSSQAGS